MRKMPAGQTGWVVGTLIVAGLAPGIARASDPVSVDWQAIRQEVQGFGACSAWYDKTVGAMDDAARERFVRFAFDPQSGIGLSIHRIRIVTKHYPQGAADFDWQEPEMQAALKFYKAVAAYKPTVLASPWTPPAWMKDNGELKKGGSLRKEHYAAYAACLSQWIQGLQRHAGVVTDVLSVQNEPGVKSWESCVWTTEDLVLFVREHLLPRLAADKVTVRFLGAEDTGWGDRWMKPLLDDPRIGPHLKVLGAHNYHTGLRPLPAARRSGLPLWMTEHFYEGQADDDLHYGLINARQVHQLFSVAEGNAYLFWWLMTQKKPHSALVLLTGKPEDPFVFTKKAYVFGHFSRFVRPGYRRIEVSMQPASDCFVTAFRHPTEDRFAVVLNNLGQQERVVRLQLNGFPAGKTACWRTSKSEDLAAVEAPESADGALVVRMPARSIVTLTDTGATGHNRKETVK